MPSQGEEDWSPRFNVAPTQPIPFIRQHPKEPVRELSLMRWASATAFKCVRMHRNAGLMTDSHHGFTDGDSKYASDWLRSSIGVGMTPSADNPAIIPDHEPKQEQSLDHQRSSTSPISGFQATWSASRTSRR